MSADSLDSEESSDSNESEILLLTDSIRAFRVFNCCSMKSKFSHSLLDMMIDLSKVAMFDFSTMRFSIDEIVKESKSVDDIEDLVLNDRDASNDDDDDCSEVAFDCSEVFSMK